MLPLISSLLSACLPFRSTSHLILFLVLISLTTVLSQSSSSDGVDGDGMILVGSDGLTYTGANFTVGTVNLLQKLQELESRVQSLSGIIEVKDAQIASLSSRSTQLESILNHTLVQLQNVTSSVSQLRTIQQSIASQVDTINNQSLAIKYKVFTTNTTYAPPANVQYITVEMIGGGGGAGGSTGISGPNPAWAFWAGSGGYVFKILNSPDLKQMKSLYFVFGSGGKGGRTGLQKGTMGGNSTLFGDGRPIIIATGGEGGLGSANYTALSQIWRPQSGIGVGGDFNYGSFTKPVGLLTSIAPNATDSTFCRYQDLAPVVTSFGAGGSSVAVNTGDLISYHCWGRDGMPGAALITEYFLF
jgi:hypothetical protein